MSRVASIGVLVVAGSALGQTACPVFSAGPAAQPIVAGQTGTLTLTVQSGARFVTNEGTIDINLMLDSAPNTSANFLTYVRSGRYNGVIFHRSVPLNIQSQLGVIQGGGFKVPTQAITQWPTQANPLTAAQRPLPIATDPPIAIEHAVGNIRGTIAMARTSDPVSATSQFFINTVDNNVDVPGQRFSLDAVPGTPGREGYAVFGTVTPASLAVVDAIKNRVVFDLSDLLLDYTFGETPLRVSVGNFPLLPSQYVTITSATPTATPAASWPGGAGWTYRWRRNGVDLVDGGLGGRVSGAAGGTLSIAGMTVADFGVYDCVVTNLACSGGTVLSSTVTLACPADLGVAGGAAGADGVLDNNDFISFINFFFAADAKADFGKAGGEAGADGAFDNNDFIVFIDRFFNGC